jgi:hydrogenase expression/formation protein HypC
MERRQKESGQVCLAIPGQIVEVVEADLGFALVEVGGVRRTINVGLLDGPQAGDWVLIHVGFAISAVDEAEAMLTLDLLRQLGASYEQELEELKTSAIG